MSYEDWVGWGERIGLVTADIAIEETCGFVTQSVLALWEDTVLPLSVTGDLAPEQRLLNAGSGACRVS